MKSIFKSIIRIVNKTAFILTVAIIVIFSINNPQVVTISLSPLSLEVETRLFIVILFCFAAGILIGFLCSSVSLTKEKFRNFISGWKIKKLEKKVEKIEINKAKLPM